MAGKIDNMMKKLKVKQPKEESLKEINGKSKLIAGDIDFVHDRIELLKNLCSIESHSWSSYVKSVINELIKSRKSPSEITKEIVEKAIKDKWGDAEERRRFDLFRKMRRDYLKPLVDMSVEEGWCFAPRTKIITSSGMKNIEDLTTKDRVLTHKNRFRRIKEIMRRSINEEIVEIDTNYSNVNLKVTGNHLFYVANDLRTPQKESWKRDNKKSDFVWKKAENLTRNDFLYLPRYNFVQDIQKINIHYTLFEGRTQEKNYSYNLEVSKNLMRLIGLYLAEGHHSEGKETSIKKGKISTQRTESIGFSFSKSEENLADFVVKSFKEIFSYDTKPLFRKHTIEFNISKRKICAFFKQFGDGAPNKKVPSWIVNLPNEKLIYLVKGMIEGDGDINKFSIRYTTISEELAHSLRLMLSKLGILVSLNNRGIQKGGGIIKGRKIIPKHEIYRMGVSGDFARKLADLCKFDYIGGKKTSGNFAYASNDYFLIPILRIKKENYKGDVFNLSVEEDESYSTFNGVAHNCRSKHFLEAMMRMQENAARYVMIGMNDEAVKCALDYGKLYFEFLEMNGLNK